MLIANPAADDGPARDEGSAGRRLAFWGVTERSDHCLSARLQTREERRSLNLPHSLSWARSDPVERGVNILSRQRGEGDKGLYEGFVTVVWSCRSSKCRCTEGRKEELKKEYESKREIVS